MRALYLLLLLPVIAACGGSSEETTEEETLVNNFHIEGTITGASLQKVKIEAFSQNGAIAVAETMTDNNGKYVLDGNIPGMGIYTLSVGKDPANAIVLPLDVNDRATISGDIGNFGMAPKMSGTKWAKPLTRYMELFNEFIAKQAELKGQEPAAIYEKSKALRKPLEQFVEKQISSDPANSVNLILTNVILPASQEELASWDPKYLDLLKKMESAYLEKHGDSPLTATLSEQISQLQAAYDGYARFNSGTMAAPEIALKNPDGKELRLSSLRGKVVLIDFWASWCGPCRKENPNVVKMYKKFKSKGFEIFSVSLDQDPNAWKTAITRDGLDWPNHVSDLMGWQTPLTQSYGFNAIPYTVLLNREGNIIAVNLRGAELEQKLEAELAKK